MENVLKIEVEIKAPELVQAIEGLKGLFLGATVTNSVQTAEPQKEVAIQTIVEVEPEEAVAEKEPEATSDKPIALEDVRAVLSVLTKAGKKEAVSALFASFGGKRLTDIKPSDYAELIKKAGEIK